MKVEAYQECGKCVVMQRLPAVEVDVTLKSQV